MKPLTLILSLDRQLLLAALPTCPVCHAPTGKPCIRDSPHDRAYKLDGEHEERTADLREEVELWTTGVASIRAFFLRAERERLKIDGFKPMGSNEAVVLVTRSHVGNLGGKGPPEPGVREALRNAIDALRARVLG